MEKGRAVPACHTQLSTTACRHHPAQALLDAQGKAAKEAAEADAAAAEVVATAEEARRGARYDWPATSAGEPGQTSRR